MKNLIISIASLVLILTSCTSNTLSQEQEQQLLDDLYLDIQTLANSEPCSNPEDWAFTAIGAKACGGPAGYIAYPLSIDTVSFLDLVTHYTKEQEKYNIKWGVFSDCSVAQPPSGIECLNGEPTFIY
ncbi:MAG: hypothetical protein L3J45_06735 [Flavobacteriaceae bacterium]|nr:hypothetical protein [Flavobacteriaceae bacterium]